MQTTLEKREAFAVSLRKTKAKALVSKKRARIIASIQNHKFADPNYDVRSLIQDQLGSEQAPLHAIRELVEYQDFLFEAKTGSLFEAVGDTQLLLRFATRLSQDEQAAEEVEFDRLDLSYSHQILQFTTNFICDELENHPELGESMELCTMADRIWSFFVKIVHKFEAFMKESGVAVDLPTKFEESILACLLFLGNLKTIKTQGNLFREIARLLEGLPSFKEPSQMKHTIAWFLSSQTATMVESFKLAPTPSQFLQTFFCECTNRLVLSTGEELEDADFAEIRRNTLVSFVHLLKQEAGREALLIYEEWAIDQVSKFKDEATSFPLFNKLASLLQDFALSTSASLEQIKTTITIIKLFQAIAAPEDEETTTLLLFEVGLAPLVISAGLKASTELKLLQATDYQANYLQVLMNSMVLISDLSQQAADLADGNPDMKASCDALFSISLKMPLLLKNCYQIFFHQQASILKMIPSQGGDSRQVGILKLVILIINLISTATPSKLQEVIRKSESEAMLEFVFKERKLEASWVLNRILMLTLRIFHVCHIKEANLAELLSEQALEAWESVRCEGWVQKYPSISRDLEQLWADDEENDLD